MVERYKGGRQRAGGECKETPSAYQLLLADSLLFYPWPVVHCATYPNPESIIPHRRRGRRGKLSALQGSANVLDLSFAVGSLQDILLPTEVGYIILSSSVSCYVSLCVCAQLH